MIPKKLLKNQIIQTLKANGYDDTTAKSWGAVSQFETGNFTSDIFKNNNNLFGMRLPRVRETTATDSRNNFAVYPDRMHSIWDIVLYLDAVDFPKRNNSYWDVIREMKKRSYFGKQSAEDYFQRSYKWFYGNG